MALLNKLFVNRRKSHIRHRDSISYSWLRGETTTITTEMMLDLKQKISNLFSFNGTKEHKKCTTFERLFPFSKDQVRVVLFRECDFRGRKLLFDSQAVRKVALAKTNVDIQQQTREPPKETYAETSNGHGYTFAKPNADFKQLGEMIFGSVAMSYRGTSYKIHHLSSPQRLMYTQVFPSPRGAKKTIREHGNRNGFQNSNQERMNDSGASSINSMSEQMSFNSNSSDAVLVCRTLPLDVPVVKTAGNSAVSSLEINGDSGFVGEQSFSSGGSSDNQSLMVGNVPHFLGGSVTVSSGSLYKRWLRSTSTSLEHSGSHINSSASADECCPRTHHRNSKLGLAIIIHLSPDEFENMSHFLMEHAALIESMVWRARQGVEAAYLRSYNFISLMYDMTDCICQCLLELFTGPRLPSSLWLSLSNGCDNVSVSKPTTDMQKTASWNSLTSKLKTNGSKSCSALNVSCNSDGYLDKSGDFTFLNITKLLRSEVRECISENRKNPMAEKFVNELCELLESVDVKHTNFFISTLLTAVLTHHLGWVATTFSTTHVDSEIHKPYNVLWGQLIDLYGAVGHPAKTAHTVITGTNNTELISKILNSLTYFIRCCDIERKNATRVDIEKENSVVDSICREYSCIPKEYYKKYEDHLREMESFNAKMRSIRKEAALKYRNEPQTPVIALKKPVLAPKKLDMEGQARTNGSIAEEEKRELPVQEERKVVFVLGDDERLEDIKRESTCNDLNGLKPAASLGKGLKKETSCFNLKQFMEQDNESDELATLTVHSFDNSEFKDEHFVKYNGPSGIKPSTSFTSLEANSEAGCSGSKSTNQRQNESEFSRSKSVPPEDHKPESSDEVKSRYKYCGVKFNFQQYPQIVTNYMKSKNIELSRLPFTEKEIDFNQITLNAGAAFHFMDSDDSGEEVEALQTPSNASELECVSDLVTERHKECHAKESVERLPKSFIRAKVPNTVIREPFKDKESEHEKNDGNMKIISLPMPKSMPCLLTTLPVGYTTSLMRGLSDHYLSDMVLQGTSAPKSQWEATLRSDLTLAARHPLLDQPIEEAVAIIANIDTWEVQLMSSHTFVVDKGCSGVRVGMSQLVANMLESLLQMWKLHAPAEHCLLHIEQRLQEFLMRSKALAHLLLATEFCTMDFLTSTLQLEVNDVPLLMAVASTHTPQVTEKYGLSFQ